MNKVRKTLKTTIVIVIALSMLALLTTGCGKEQGGQTQATAKNGSSAQATTQTQEKLSISIVPFNQNGFPNEETNKVQKILEEKYNIELKNVPLDIFNTDNMNLYFAEGDLADCVTLVANIDWRNLAEQGILRPIPDDFLSKYAPKWMEKIEELLGKELVDSQLKYKGKIYGLPTVNYSTTAKEIIAVRKDWMDNIGIVKLPETIDEIHEMAKKFTNNDPDQNNKKDTYAFHAPESVGRFLFAAYGIQKDMYFLDNGKVQFSDITDNYKEVLKLLATFYKEGLIDPEFVTDDGNKQKQKIVEGKFGILSAHPWMFCSTTPLDYNYPKLIADKNPKASFAYIPAVKGPAGTLGAWQAYPDIWATAGVFFTKNCSDEKVIKILQMKEGFIEDPELNIRSEYGIEGKTFIRDANGLISLIPEATKPEMIVKEGIKAYSITPMDWEDAAGLVLSPDDIKIYSISKDVAPVFGSWVTFQPAVAFPAPGINEALKQYGATIDTISKEFYYNCITGKIDIDKEWESYKKNWLDNGGAKVLENYQKLYDTASGK